MRMDETWFLNLRSRCQHEPQVRLRLNKTPRERAKELTTNGCRPMSRAVIMMRVSCGLRPGSTLNLLRRLRSDLPDVFPVPGLEEVRTKPETRCIPHQPTISRRINLDCPICILRINRLASDIEIQCASGEVWTVDC